MAVTVTLPPLPSRTQSVCWFALALLIISLFIIKHPYHGIIHDSRLYTVEALHKLNSQNYINDFYFFNTYQSRFSITNGIYAKGITLFGLTTANLLLLVVGQVLWLVGAFLATGVFFRGFNQFAALALVVSFPSQYGGFDIFSFAEPFYSPRLISEAFVLLALPFWARRNWLVCVFCMIVAFVVHPLMAIPGVIALALPTLRNHKKLLWALVPAGLALVALAALGVEPFSNIFTVMDGNWLEATQDRCKFLFISLWPTKDLILPLAMLALGFMAYARTTGKQKQLVGAILLTSLLCNATSLIFGDLLHDALIIQLQLWRSSWLLFYIVAVFFYDIVSASCVKSPVGLAAAALLCLFIFGVVAPPYSYAALLLCFALFAALRWTSLANIVWGDANARNRVILYVFVLLSILLILKSVDHQTSFFGLQRDEDPWKGLSLALPILTGIALFVGRFAFREGRSCIAWLVTASMRTRPQFGHSSKL